ncbi:thermonuclease family protein [Sphingomonas sp. C3-2]|uniref:thermonuclease family protein n=1 Tax=Sphingomonas sp. C3-2 TaxID=3062169 RepID=UPI00294AC10D|nr:thermonuclease family protein [Sphingomonas sp. C3-2]WOK35620.1 thermonuclease family protein [Sphingomonas sp. C3-2]
MYRVIRRLFGSLAALAFVALAALFGFSDPTREFQALGASDPSLRISDGDSFRLDGTRYRLHGIDAPESKQSCTDAKGREWACGQQARTYLAGLIDPETLECADRGPDKYGRTLATCRTARTPDIGAAMVRAGMAVSYSREKIPPYSVDEVRARSAARGIWAGDFTRPEDWRREQKQARAAR